MQIVQIEFDPESGLSFHKIDNGKKKKIWVTAIDTLNQMSLSDLNYCISTNVFADLDELHGIFKDYLWTEDGAVEPKKKSDEPR
jgi:hypothetical protein